MSSLASARPAHLDGSVARRLLALAAPTTAVFVAQSVVGVAETWYVGFLGRDALAGVSLVFPVQMLMTMLSNGGIGTGVGSAVARAVGAERRDDADRLTRVAVLMAALFGLVFGVATWALGPSLYRALGGRGAALDAAVTYSNALFAGSIPFWTVNLLAAALRGAGDVRVPARVTLVGAGVVVVASPAFIFGIGPLPGLGIAGAGIAVALYYTAAAAWMLRHLASGRATLRLTRGPVDAALVRDVLRVGLPTAASSMQPNLTALALTGTVGLFGVDSIAGYGVASRLDYLLVPVLFGLGSATLTLVGTSVGAGDLERARKTTRLGATLGFGIAGGVGLLAALAPRAWLGLFTHDPRVLSVGEAYLRTVAPFYGVFGAGFVLAFALQGEGRAVAPALAGTLRMLVAAGLGWALVAKAGLGLAALFGIVAASLLAYGGAMAWAVFGARRGAPTKR